MGKFKISGSEKNYRFNLHASNGEIIGRCTQGYSSKDACKTGISSVKTNSNANIVDTTNDQSDTGARYEIYKSGTEHRFRLIAQNGENILASEGYTSKQGCQTGIDSVITNAPKAITEE